MIKTSCYILLLFYLLTYTIELKAEDLITITNCSDRNCLLNPTDIEISNDGSFFLVADSTTKPQIKKIDFTQDGFSKGTIIFLNIDNPNKTPLDISLSKNNEKLLVYKPPSLNDNGLVQTIKLSDSSIKNINPSTISKHKIDAARFLDSEGKKIIAATNNANTFNLQIINSEKNQIEKTFSLPDRVNFIAVSPDFKKVVISFRDLLTQSILIYEVETNKMTRLDTPTNIFFKINDFILNDKFNILGDKTVISVNNGVHLMPYLSLLKDRIVLRILNSKNKGKSLSRISPDGSIGITISKIDNKPFDFIIYKINLLNKRFPIISSKDILGEGNVLDAAITPDQNKIIILTSNDKNKILKTYDIKDLSLISELTLSSDTSSSTLNVDPKGNYIVVINQRDENPLSLVTNFSDGLILNDINPKEGFIDRNTLFIIDGFIDPSKFSNDLIVCFNNTKYCATSVIVSGDGKRITGLTPKASKPILADLILIAETINNGKVTSTYKKIFKFAKEKETKNTTVNE